MTRTRNKNGKFREKRWDTHMGTIEKMYRKKFWVRPDMRLDTFLEIKGVKSLWDLMRK